MKNRTCIGDIKSEQTESINQRERLRTDLRLRHGGLKSLLHSISFENNFIHDFLKIFYLELFPYELFLYEIIHKRCLKLFKPKTKLQI